MGWDGVLVYLYFPGMAAFVEASVARSRFSLLLLLLPRMELASLAT